MMDFDVLHAEYHQRVLMSARRLVGSTDADDIAQEVWLRAWRGLPTFRGDASVSSWLFRITFNVAMSWYRIRARRIVTEPIEAAADKVSPAPSPMASLISAERSAQLDRAILLLPRRQQDVIFGLLLDQSRREVGEVLRIPTETVKTRAMRARTILRTWLQAA